MVQEYQSAGAVEVVKRILKKIPRNDLVEKLANIGSGAAGQSQEQTNMTSHPDSRSVSRNSLCLYIYHHFRYSPDRKDLDSYMFLSFRLCFNTFNLK